MTDKQKKKVYGWEDGWIDWRSGKRLSEADVRYWVRWACKLYGITPPKVRFHARQFGGTSYYQPGDHFIEFRRRHMNVWSALHEAAHAITDTLLGDNLEGHGPQFVGTFATLLAAALPHSIERAKLQIKTAPAKRAATARMRKR
jgi:hypothetical protein